MAHKVGIDAIGFYTSNYFLDLRSLATERGINPEKFYVGLGQKKMSVPPPGEDVVTMGANAALAAIKNIDTQSIAMVLFATESGIDQSKAAGIYVHHLLNLPSNCRVIELKQACYGATFALQLALPFLQLHPDKKVLVIASDIARYGLKSIGESSQGCGAIALVLSVNPRILALDPEYGVVTENIMDFWRPNYSDSAFVEGKYSSKMYLNMLEKVWRQYQTASNRNYNEHDYFCYHTPVPKLVEKAHGFLAKINNQILTEETIISHLAYVLEYGRQIGNSYTASLYISLIALLELSTANLSNKRIGFYSYGSGCVAEYFSGVVQPNYQIMLNKNQNAKMLDARIELSYAEYEKFYTFKYIEDNSAVEIPAYLTGNFRLNTIENHKRIYEKLS